MMKLTKSEILQKCIMVFEGLRRYSSKGGAGLEAERGAEHSFELNDAMVQGLKEWQREIMENGAPKELKF